MSCRYEDVSERVESGHLSASSQGQTGGEIDDATPFDFVERHDDYNDPFGAKGHGEFDRVVEFHGKENFEAVIGIACAYQRDAHR